MHDTPCTDALCVQACYEQLLDGKQPAIPSDEPEQHSPLKRGRKRKTQQSFQAALEEAERAAASDGEMDTAAQPQHPRPLVCFQVHQEMMAHVAIEWFHSGSDTLGTPAASRDHSAQSRQCSPSDIALPEIKRAVQDKSIWCCRQHVSSGKARSSLM